MQCVHPRAMPGPGGDRESGAVDRSQGTATALGPARFSLSCAATGTAPGTAFAQPPNTQDGDRDGARTGPTWVVPGRQSGPEENDE